MGDDVTHLSASQGDKRSTLFIDKKVVAPKWTW